MGWYIKKSLRFGPLRVNLSKSGVGVSAGVKGLRVSTGPRGTQVNAGRGGIYYRKSLGKNARRFAGIGLLLLLILLAVGAWLVWKLVA